MFGAVKLTKNFDPDKYSYSGYATGFHFCSLFLFPNFDWGKNVVIFGVGNSSSVHVDSKKEDISVFSKGPTKIFFVNATKIHQFKAKDFFTTNNMNKTGLNGCVYSFSIITLLIIVMLLISINI